MRYIHIHKYIRFEDAFIKCIYLFKQDYNGSDRDFGSDFGDADLPNEYIPPPSVVTRNVVLEGQLSVWNELRKYDQNNTGTYCP